MAVETATAADLRAAVVIRTAVEAVGKVANRRRSRSPNQE
jgi:hypothetical protein